MAEQSATEDFDPRLWVWGTSADRPRVLHTMLRVNDFEASMRFYVDGLGMKVLDRFDIESRRATAYFLGFSDYDAGGCLELVRGWDADGPYTHGTGYGHVAIGVPDMDALLARLKAMGVAVGMAPTPLIKGSPLVAFVKDPNGYDVELIQTRRR